MYARLLPFLIHSLMIHDYRQFIISLLYQRSLIIRAIIARSILKNDRLSHWFSDELIEDNQGKYWEEIDAKRKTI
jgi:hypothetical protein